MSKATPANVTDIGFHAQQFGAPPDWATTPGGYLQRLLDEVALEVRAEVGESDYDGAAAGTLLHKRLVTAEAYLAAAELWRRLEQFERASAVRGRDGNSAETIGSRLLANANDYEARAWAEIARITGRSYGSGITTGTVESGPYEAVS